MPVRLSSEKREGSIAHLFIERVIIDAFLMTGFVSGKFRQQFTCATLTGENEYLGRAFVPNLYETDYYLWLEQQKKHLRNRQYDRLDLDNLIEEVEDMGNELDTLESRFTTLILHLLKYHYQTQVLNPVLPEPYNCREWLATIDRTRLAINKLIKKKPHLKSVIESCVSEAYPDARMLAVKEMNRYVMKHQRLTQDSFPAQCPWLLDRLIEENWLP